MIDRETGAISFGTLRLEPATTRARFLESLPDGVVKPLVDNPPHRSYATQSADRHGNLFGISAYFTGERLTMVHLSAIDDRFGRSWAEWSKEKELALKAHHTNWLRDECGIAESESFSWGEVASSFDEKGGSSSIIVQYSGN